MRGDIPSFTDEPQNNLKHQVFKEKFENILSIAVDIAFAETEWKNTYPESYPTFLKCVLWTFNQ